MQPQRTGWQHRQPRAGRAGPAGHVRTLDVLGLLGLCRKFRAISQTVNTSLLGAPGTWMEMSTCSWLAGWQDRQGGLVLGTLGLLGALCTWMDMSTCSTVEYSELHDSPRPPCQVPSRLKHTLPSW